MLSLSGFELYYRWLPPLIPLKVDSVVWIYKNVLCCFIFSICRWDAIILRGSQFTHYNLSVLCLCVNERPE